MPCGARRVARVTKNEAERLHFFFALRAPPFHGGTFARTVTTLGRFFCSAERPFDQPPRLADHFTQQLLLFCSLGFVDTDLFISVSILISYLICIFKHQLTFKFSPIHSKSFTYFFVNLSSYFLFRFLAQLFIHKFTL